MLGTTIQLMGPQKKLDDHGTTWMAYYFNWIHNRKDEDLGGVTKSNYIEYPSESMNAIGAMYVTQPPITTAMFRVGSCVEVQEMVACTFKNPTGITLSDFYDVCWEMVSKAPELSKCETVRFTMFLSIPINGPRRIQMIDEAETRSFWRPWPKNSRQIEEILGIAGNVILA